MTHGQPEANYFKCLEASALHPIAHGWRAARCNMLGRMAMPAVESSSNIERPRITLRALAEASNAQARAMLEVSAPAFATLLRRPALACCGVAFVAERTINECGSPGVDRIEIAS
jgi:hypothetical protein